jgi:hypothetical protein
MYLLLQYFLVEYHSEFHYTRIQFEGAFHLLSPALYSDIIYQDQYLNLGSALLLP